MSCIFLNQFILHKKNETSTNSIPPITIGAGTDALNKCPIYGLYDYSQMSVIYLASDLNNAGANAGNINSLQFQFTGWGENYTVNNQEIYLSHITENAFSGSPDPSLDEYNISNTVMVKKKFTWKCPSNQDWEQFVFDTPFNWNGTSNILITWKNSDGSWNSGYGMLKGNSYQKNRSWTWYSDYRYPTASAWNGGGLPNIKFNSPGVTGHIN